MEDLILALDQSTSASKVYLLDAQAHILSSALRRQTKYRPQEGWVEQDPWEIYLQTLDAFQEVLTGVDPQRLAALTLTNQRETVVVWDAQSGKPIYPAIVWQCTRTHERCQQLIAEGKDALVSAKTGLKIDSYFSATKIAWILDHVEGARARARQGLLKFGTMESWLLYVLSEEHVHRCDHTNASRTLLYNIHTHAWDAQLCELFDIPMQMLPQILSSDDCFATTTLNGRLHKPIAVSGVMGDSQAAFFGHGCFAQGDVKLTLGTGCSIMMHTDTVRQGADGLVCALGYRLQKANAYALEGIVNCNGEALLWAKHQLRLFQDYREIDEALLYGDLHSDIRFVPALTGLGFPYWDEHARGALVGISAGATPRDLLRAIVKGVMYQICDALDRFALPAGKVLHVDGGIAQNAALMQFLADMSQHPVEVVHYPDIAVLGSFLAADLYLGRKKRIEEARTATIERSCYHPKLPEESSERALQEYRAAVEAVRRLSQKR